MDKQQTAVQWLLEKMQSSPMDQKEVENAFKTALQMERERIEKAFDSGVHDYDEFNLCDGEQYFTKTFNP